MIHCKLDKVLQEKGMTQKQLSELTGIRRASISYFCRDMLNRMNFRHISEMCRVLDCQPNEIMEYIPDQEYLNMVKKKILLEAEAKRKKAEEKQFKIDLRMMKIEEDLENKKRLEERRKAIKIEREKRKKLEAEKKKEQK